MLTNAPRGTKDILPDTVGEWNYVEGKIREICGRYGFEEIRTPLFEHTELFHRGIGEGTDVVDKEMYTFEDRGGRSITLRPENTASVVRAYLQNKLYGDASLVKLFYIGSMFRYDRRPAACANSISSVSSRSARRTRWPMLRSSCWPSTFCSRSDSRA